MFYEENDDNSSEPNSENKQVHFQKETKVLLDNEAYRFRDDVVGNFGRVEGKGFITKYLAEFRYALTPKQKDRLRTETIMIVRLLQHQSPRALRVIKHGEVNGLKYIVTTPVGKSLDSILAKFQKMHISALLHLILQTYLCIRDVHSTRCGHFDIRPGSFSLRRTDSKMLIFSSFQRCTRFGDLRSFERERRIRQFSRITKYSSRRTHKGQRVGQADDLESWIFMIYEILHGEPLKWSKMKYGEMGYNKWVFIRTYSSKNKAIEKRMKIFIKLIWASNVRYNDNVHDNIYRELADWVEQEPSPDKQFPWEVK